MEDEIIRSCGPGDIPAVARLVGLAFRPSDPDPMAMARSYPLLFDAANAGNLFVAERQGQIVAHAGLCMRQVVSGATRYVVGLVGAVCTDPRLRGQGIATRCLRRLIDQAGDQGAHALFASGAGALYARLGFIRRPPARAYLLTSSDAAVAGSAGVECQAMGPDDASILAAIHNAEPMRWLRTLAQWRAILAAGMVYWNRGTVYLFTQQRRPVGYAAIEDAATLKLGACRARRVVEWAGDRPLVIAGLARLAQSIEGPLAPLLGKADPPFEDGLLAAGATAHAVPLPFSDLALRGQLGPPPDCGLDYM